MEGEEFRYDDRHCPDDPRILSEVNVCLSALSKDMHGDLYLTSSMDHTCEWPPCQTLTMSHRLVVKVEPHACDSELGRYFDGLFKVERLVTIFDPRANRGFHAGDFLWAGQDVQAAGRVSGMTNVGTHREPFFEPCQRCYAPGVMEGRLCGSVIDTKVTELLECQLIGSYRIRLRQDLGSVQGYIEATFEGVLVCPCRG